MKDIVDRQPNENCHCKKLVRKLLISSCSERDYCAQEVMHFLMSYKFYHSSRDFVIINLNQFEWQALGKSEHHKPFLCLYAQRPHVLYNLSLFYVSQHYQYISGSWELRKKKAVVRVFPKVHKEEGVDNQFYYDIMFKLHVPWFSEDDFFSV
jgi:hypothetical protein